MDDRQQAVLAAPILDQAPQHAAPGHPLVRGSRKAFDLRAAERVRTFFTKFLRHSKGQWAGQPFRAGASKLSIVEDREEVAWIKGAR